MSKLFEGTQVNLALNLIGVTIGTPFLLVLFYAAKVFITAQSSPLMKLQCPPGGQLFLGHMLQFTQGKSYDTLQRWSKQYGRVFAIKSVLGVSDTCH